MLLPRNIISFIIRTMQPWKFEAGVVDILQKTMRPALSQFEARIHDLEMQNSRLKADIELLKSSLPGGHPSDQDDNL